MCINNSDCDVNFSEQKRPMNLQLQRGDLSRNTTFSISSQAIFIHQAVKIPYYFHYTNKTGHELF